MKIVPNFSIYFFSLALVTLLFTTLLTPKVCAQGSNNNGATPCNGSIGECQVEEEFLMESEITTRFLQGGSNRVTEPIMKKDMTICKAKGLPYTGSSCLPKAKPPKKTCRAKIYQYRC
eukprot:TRINITY_DN194_c0_g1_i2.p1 TRINITY_DN194_c0_g1~~TRINITY_DN194_c0_g1_i2.p1  ORF type:complete len:118 (+),score=11.89 TRINITY_DN194_c0_g1_i2:107-460(+)